MDAKVMENPASAKDAARRDEHIKSMISDAVEDRVRSADRALKHARYAAEDAIEETKHTIKQKPFHATGIAFAAGLVTGCCLSWIGFRRR